MTVPPSAAKRTPSPWLRWGILGLLIGAVNFALIALEEVYLVVLASRRCG